MWREFWSSLTDWPAALSREERRDLLLLPILIVLGLLHVTLLAAGSTLP